MAMRLAGATVSKDNDACRARIAKETSRCYHINQFGNPANPVAHEVGTGPEIWEQLDHRVDAIVCGVGSGGMHFNSHKSDSFACRLKSDEAFDETRFFSSLKLDVERALHDNGAQITDSGSSGAASFYFAYALKNVRGRVQV